MIDDQTLDSAFTKHGGILRTTELNQMGLSSRQIKKLVENKSIRRIKQGYYEQPQKVVPDEVLVARLFPEAILFLESALIHYEYTDRIPKAIQIAVDKDSEKTKYRLDYPPIEPHFMESKYLGLGLDRMVLDGVSIRIYDRDRTLCDVLRYEKKLEKEVFSQAIQRYVRDPQKNIRKLHEYAKKLNISRKAEQYIGVWL